METEEDFPYDSWLRFLLVQDFPPDFLQRGRALYHGLRIDFSLPFCIRVKKVYRKIVPHLTAGLQKEKEK